MGKVVLVLALLVSLLTGCTQPKYEAYYTVSIDNETSVVSDGIHAYDMAEGTLSNKRPLFPSEKKPCLSFFSTGTDYDLTEQALCNYLGTLYDVSNYRQSLLDDGYVTVTYKADSNYIDTRLEKDGHAIRIIYFSDGRIKLFEGGEYDVR